jgi:transposase
VQRDVVDDARHLAESQRRIGRAGLAPSVRSSDGKARLGHMTRQGSPALRWALVEAAQKITAGSGPLRERFERIAKRRGRKIAKVADDGRFKCVDKRSA